MSSLAVVAEVYARHGGHPSPARLHERLGSWPLWARAAARLCALMWRWAFPLVLLGRPAAFERLSAAELETLLLRLQQSRSPLLRAMFLTVKAAVLGACYAPSS